MASMSFREVYLGKTYSIVGPPEREGKLKNYNNSIADFYYGESTFEKCEVKMQKEVIDNLNNNNIDLVVGGDLLNQITATSYSMRDFNIPYVGLYSACATFAEALIVLSSFLNSSLIKNGLAITSSHNLTSERQFRYPIEYGGVKPERSTFTATGAVGAIVCKERTKVAIKNATIGKVIDYEIKDANYLGAAMAPACAMTIIDHFNDFKLDSNYYDIVLTGDLGKSGLKLLKVLLAEKNIDIKNIKDAGSMIYSDDQNLYDGASGPVALPLILMNDILKKKKYGKILIVATGALHSVTTINQKNTIPGIAYAVSLEVK